MMGEVIMKNHISKIISLIILLVSLVTIAFVFTGCSRFTIDCKEAIKATFTGLDGYGKIETDFDENLYEFDLNETDLELLAGTKWNYTPNKNLKNGDNVTIKVSYSKSAAKKAKISFKNTEFDVKVSGLKKGEIINPFEGLNVSYTGVSGGGNIKIDKIDCDRFIKDTVDFSTTSNSNLKNGEKIKITATFSEDKSIKEGYIIEPTEQEFVVAGLDGYLTEKSQITADIDNQLSNDSKEGIDTYLSKLDGHHIFFGEFSEENVSKTFTGKSGSIDAANSSTLYKKIFVAEESKLYYIYKVDLTIDGAAATGYFTISYNNLLVTSDGKLKEITENNSKWETPTKEIVITGEEF